MVNVFLHYLQISSSQLMKGKFLCIALTFAWFWGISILCLKKPFADLAKTYSSEKNRSP